MDALRFAVFVNVAVVAATAAHAATNNFVVPTHRGLSDSRAGYWESFTVPFGPPGNSANMAGSTTTAILTQTLSPASFVTGSGNIYNPSAAMSFVLSETSPFDLGSVILQTRTLGAEIDYSAVSLSYLDGTDTVTVAPLFRWELDRGADLGASVSSLWQWDLTGHDVASYTITFGSAGSSLSLDSVTLDTWSQFAVVPEPSTYALLGLGLGFFGWMAAGRRR